MAASNGSYSARIFKEEAASIMHAFGVSEDALYCYDNKKCQIKWNKPTKM